MIWTWFNTLLVLIAAVAVYRFGPRLFAAVKRFDDGNRRRIDREISDRTDRQAHFRHTIETADEQVEDVSELAATDMRTGTPVTLYLFEGETYSTRDAAEQARARKVYDLAKDFYLDLPVALAERRRGKLS